MEENKKWESVISALKKILEDKDNPQNIKAIEELIQESETHRNTLKNQNGDLAKLEPE